MGELRNFFFDSKEVRFVNGLAVGIDVASILGINDPTNAVYRIRKEWKVLVNITDDFETGQYEMSKRFDAKARRITTLKEPGIYELIMKSRLPSADRFKVWLFEEVLPQIRATGNYSSQPLSKETPSAIKAAEAANYIMSLLGDNQPRLAQYLIDHAVNEILEKHETKSLSSQGLSNLLPVTQEPMLRGVVEIAEEMGMQVNNYNRSQLGKFIRSQLTDIVVKERRLVNGAMREVYVYPDGERIRTAIKVFFNA